MFAILRRRALPIAAALAISTAAALVIAIRVPAFAMDKGSAAPNCKLSLIDGKASTSLSQLPGKVLYVDFWASWCVPCAASFPFMNKLDKELSGKGLQVVAINLDEKPDDAKKFLAKHPVRFSIAVKANETCAKEFGVQGMPSSFIVDRKGVIRLVHPGFKPGDAGKLRSLVGQLLAEH
ncbi:MAG: TlpA disulfide reductase family protein [Hyphomicrobium sp.]